VASNGALNLNFGWNWLNHRPILWTVFVVVVGIGVAYYGLVQRNKPSHIEAPEGELVADDAAPAASPAAG